MRGRKRKKELEDRLPSIQDADLAGKVVLVRVDHNVVKKGIIRDPYRIDRTIGTLYNIVERGGRIILMTHVGRPRDKKTGEAEDGIRDSVASRGLGDVYKRQLCAKYNIRMAGVPEADISAAKKLVSQDKKARKIVELPHFVEADILGKKVRGKYRTVEIQDLVPGKSYGYGLDIDQRSFSDKKVAGVIGSAKTIFVNAVMGYTPHFTEGSEALDRTIDKNPAAWKFYGGGDTLQEFKSLCPGLYLAVLDDALYYFFTGGGSVLKAIETNDAFGMKPIQALIENKKALEKGLTR